MIKSIIQTFIGANSADVSNISYPAEILSHSGKPLPVSKGGIVLINEPEDILLLPSDGITLIEVDRDLGDKFYKASEDADQEDVELLSGFFIEIDKAGNRARNGQSINIHESYNEVFNLYSQRSMSERQKILVQQAIADVKQFYDPAKKLSVSMNTREDWPEPYGFGGFGQKNIDKETGEEKDEEVKLHVELGVIARSLWPYIGATSMILNSRIEESEMEKMASPISYGVEEQVGFSKMLMSKYDIHRPKLGNPYFFKGYTYDFDSKPDVQNLIKNASVHSEPDSPAEDPRYLNIFDI